MNRGPQTAKLARAEDVRFLLEQGVPAEEIPSRVGATAAMLTRWFYRNGHRDIGRVFSRVARRGE